MFVDLPLDQLRDYRPHVAEPDDFETFWHRQIASATAAESGGPRFVAHRTALANVDVLDVDFPGFAGDRVKAWLLVPRAGDPAVPVIVEYVGYNGGRGDPLEWLFWSALGHPHLIMDSRGQGGGWRTADTPDRQDTGAPSTNGYMTRGVADPADHYFTRLFVDAVRAVDAVRSHEACAGRAVISTGASQGGALATVVAGWHDAVAAAMPDVVFLSHIRRALDITDAKPFGELSEYLALRPDEADRVFATMSYFDVVNHARRAQVPALFSVALRDDIAPPSTVFATANHYGGPHEIAVYPFNDHAGGGVTHRRRQIDFVERLTRA